MTDESINCIRTVVQEKSFSRAAKKLSVSQPAISLQIKKVEKELDITIFDRKSHPLSLTQEGETLLEYLNQRDLLEKDFRERLRSLSSLERGTLRIGGTSAFNLAFVPDMVSRFSELYPGVDIKVMDGTIAQLRREILDGNLDLSILSPTQMRSGLHLEPLKETKIYYCLPPHIKLSPELAGLEIPFDRIDAPGEDPEATLPMFRDLAQANGWDPVRGLPVIRLSPERNLGQMLDALLDRDQVEDRIPVMVDQALTAYIMTLKGVGTCLMSGLDIRSFPVKEHPHCFMLSNLICRRMMYLAWKEGAVLSPAAKAYVNLLRESLREEMHRAKNPG